MAIEWMENFQNYGTGSTGLANMLDGMWAALPSVVYVTISSDPDGVSPGNVLNCERSDPFGIRPRRVLPSGTQTTVGLATRVWLSELPNDPLRKPVIVAFHNSDNEVQVTLTCETTGVLTVRRGGTGDTEIATSTVPVITAGAWNHIETKVVFDGSAGEVEVRVNGLPVITADNINTEANAPSGCAQLQFVKENSLSTNWRIYYKDMICWNGTGSKANDFVGDHDVVTLDLTADDTLTWTTSTGSDGFALVDEDTPDDAGYIQAGDPPPAVSIFDLEDLDPDYVAVLGLQTVHRSLKTDGGAGSVQAGIRSNGSDDLGADRAITVAATYWFDISDTDPDTASNWTPTSVNNAQFLLDRTA